MSEEENEHYLITEPETEVYKSSNQWYVSITIPHPDDSMKPAQTVAVPVPTEWWAKFIAAYIEEANISQWNSIVEDKFNHFPPFEEN